MIEDYAGYKEIFKYIDYYPFDRLKFTVVTSHKEFSDIDDVEFDTAIIDWNLKDWDIRDVTGEYYFNKVRAKKKYFITGDNFPQMELINCCNLYGVRVIKKPILDYHLKYLLGYNIKKNIFLV